MFAAILEYRGAIQEGLMFLLCALAFWRGAAPERAIASVFAGMWLVDRLYHAIAMWTSKFQHVDPVHFAIDAAATLAFFIIALKANRLYPLWLTALQLAAALSHLFRMASPSLQGGAYSIFVVAPSYFQIPSYGIGLLLHIRRQMKYGPYRSWRSFSFPSRATERNS